LNLNYKIHAIYKRVYLTFM